MERSAQIVDLSCVKINNISKRAETSFHLSLITKEYHQIIQNNPMPMVHLAQTMHLSCTDANIISKQTETRFDMTHVT
jgi:hypothetical protein